MANLAQLVNVIAPIFTNEKGLFLQPIYFPIAEYAKQKGQMALDVWVQSPTQTPKNRRPLGILDVSATHDAKSGTVCLNVLNRSAARDVSTRVESTAGAVDGTVDVWELSHPDLKATHTFGDDRKVRPTMRQAKVGLAGGGFVYTFPKHSLTILRLKVRS